MIDRETWEQQQVIKTLLRLVAREIKEYRDKPIAWSRFWDEDGTEMLAEVWVRPWSERFGPWPMPEPLKEDEV